MGISTVLLLVLLGTGVGAIKPTKPHSVKPIPPRESADPSEGKRIERDGNCFYRSLSLYRYHSQENYRFVRQEIMNFMSNREDRYAGLIDRNQDYAGYIRNHRQDCVWAEDAMVQAAADLYGINIFVSYYGMNGEMSQPLQVIRARSEQNSPMWLHLRLQGSHYDIINDDSKEGALEPVCKFDLLSIQDPKEIEALNECGLDILEKNKTGVPESCGSKIIPEDELPEIKDPLVEEDAINKISDGSKVNPEGERAEIQCCLMEENNIHSNTLISDEEMLERRDPPSEDTVDNICRDMKDFKIREEEKDFEDKKQKKRIKKSLHHLESQLIENRRIENERDFTSGAHITQTNELRTVENLGTLENLFTELEAEETEPVQLHGDINEVLCSDSEESIVNQTEVPSGKNSTESLQIKNMDQLRELIQNGIVGFGSHFRVRRRLGFYDYYHHFLTLETNDQSITVLHLTKTVPLYIFCEKAIVSFSNFNNTFFDFKCGVELIRWYSIPKNKTALEEINLRIEEVIALGYVNYSLTSSDKMYCASLVSYILTGEKDYKEVHEFVRHYGVFGIFLVLLVNCFCSLISNIRCLKNSVSKLKQKFTYMFKVVKSKMLDKFYSFFSYLCCILDLAASYLERSIEKTFKERKRSNKKDDS